MPILSGLIDRRRLWAWFWFTLQLLPIGVLDLGDDIFRAHFSPPDVQVALRHAQDVAGFEQAHDLFVEPALQRWFQHAHVLAGLLSFGTVVRLTDLIYALGQTLVPLAVAVWIYWKHPSRFSAVRNTALVTVILSLLTYQIYPEAPPRLTTGLMYDNHAVHFLDTMRHLIGDGQLESVPVSYSAYSAMPSLHMACALIVAGAVFIVSRQPLARLLAVLYPIVMLFTVVVSANHYLLDAAGSVVVVAVAAALTFALMQIKSSGTHKGSAPRMRVGYTAS